MSPTRKHKRSHDAEMLPQHANTMHGLNRLYDIQFEKLGWMVLAKAKGCDFKITNYRRTIDHLLKSIEQVKAEYTCPDRKHDLNVLHMNVKCLQRFVGKHL